MSGTCCCRDVHAGELCRSRRPAVLVSAACSPPSRSPPRSPAPPRDRADEPPASRRCGQRPQPFIVNGPPPHLLGEALAAAGLHDLPPGIGSLPAPMGAGGPSPTPTGVANQVPTLTGVPFLDKNGQYAHPQAPDGILHNLQSGNWTPLRAPTWQDRGGPGDYTHKALFETKVAMLNALEGYPRPLTRQDKKCIRNNVNKAILKIKNFS